VGPTVAEDIKTNAYWAVLGAMLIVFLYLLISFRKWQYGGAIAAVAHDVIFVLGIYSLFYKIMLLEWKLTSIYSGYPYCYQ
jgi:SecD/SecF fusion protein